MEYLFAPSANYQDFASGRVIRSKPGMPAFPVRLASELFLRADAYLQKRGDSPPYHIYDPVCGAGFSLTVLGFLHRQHICRLSASDIDSNVVNIAASNLALLTSKGLQLRLKELKKFSSEYSRSSYIDAIESVSRLQKNTLPLYEDSDIHTFEADALNCASIQKGIKNSKIDILFADTPYGRCVGWDSVDNLGNTPATYLLASAAQLQAIPKIIILATSKQERPEHPSFHRLKVLQNGKRRISIFAAAR